jgi:hypothetical protein
LVHACTTTHESYASGFRPSAIRRRIESVFQTLKDILTLERHGARTLENLDPRRSAPEGAEQVISARLARIGAAVRERGR